MFHRLLPAILWTVTVPAFCGDDFLDQLGTAKKITVRTRTEKPKLESTLTFSAGIGDDDKRDRMLVLAENKTPHLRVRVLEHIAQLVLSREAAPHATITLELDGTSHTLHPRTIPEAAYALRFLLSREQFQQWKREHVPVERITMKKDEDWMHEYAGRLRKSEENAATKLSAEDQTAAIDAAKKTYTEVRTELNAGLGSYLDAPPADELHWKAYSAEGKWVVGVSKADMMYYWMLFFELDPATKKSGCIIGAELFKGE